MIPNLEKIIEETLNVIIPIVSGASVTAGNELVKIKTKEIYEWVNTKFTSKGKEKELALLIQDPTNTDLQEKVESTFEVILHDEQDKAKLIDWLKEINPNIFSKTIVHNSQENKMEDNELNQKIGQVKTPLELTNKQTNEAGKNTITQTFGS
jgi:hypothetical protein